MIHGDYHTKNLELQNDEVLLIDMDTLAVGNPIFELASMYNSFVGYYEIDRDDILRSKALTGRRADASGANPWRLTWKRTVRVAVSDEPVSVTITFVDHGVPYDPLARRDPDLTLPAEERDIGGLGIFLTKQIMDDVSYEHCHGQNILRIKKTV